MSLDRGVFFVAPILMAMGVILGLVLSIVPRVAHRLFPGQTSAVSRTVRGVLVTAYLASGVWVHHALGVTYARDLAAANPENCHWGEDMSGCGPWFDGRHGWSFVWLVAGFFASARGRRACRAALDGLGGQVMGWCDSHPAKPTEPLID